MAPRAVVAYVLKLLVVTLVYIVGTGLGAALVGRLGVPTPALPGGVTEQEVARWLPVAGVLLAFTLALVSRNLRGGLGARWMILAFLTWVAHDINTALEASIFMPGAVAMVPMATMGLVASLLTAGGAACLFPPPPGEVSFAGEPSGFFRRGSAPARAWRLLLAGFAFVPVYYAFGALLAFLAPGIIDLYRQGTLGLRLPEAAVILRTQAIRSWLFLLACLPVIAAWRKPDRGLTLTLGWTLFVLVGLMGMVQAVWFPVHMRVAHGLEMLVDSLVHAWILVALLVPRKVEL